MSSNLVGQQIKTYNFTKKLGEGAFAVVYQAVQEKTNEVVAVKVIKLAELNRTKKLKQLVKTQIAVLKSCKSDNVIRYIDSFETSEYLFIVTEFCNGGDLEQHLAKKKKVVESDAVTILKQILNGFKGLHEVGAMHRDFKLANVLLHNQVCKIADLGFAKQMQERAIAKTVLGTSVTMAPQVLQEKPYGFEADIWSLGVVFYQLLYGNYPYYGRTDYELIRKIKNQRPQFRGVNISKDATDFINKCLTVEPTKRITWKQIYHHPLITSTKIKDLMPSRFKSFLNVSNNKKFYDNNKLPQNVNIEQMQSVKQIVMQVIPDQQIRASVNIESMRMIAQLQQENNDNLTKCQEYYIKKRNNIMFSNKYIEPYVQNFSYLRINHSTVLFILSKKQFLELDKFCLDMKNKKNIFSIEKGFDGYSKSDQYTKIRSQLKDDIENVRKQCQTYKQNIKFSTLQIFQQFQLNNTKNKNFDKLADGLVSEYIRLLSESLGQVNDQNKVDLIKVIQALKYLNKTKNNPETQEFDQIISTLDFAQAETELRNYYKI